MKNRKNTTKKALLMSVLSMLLCCTMLIGTTFAWFTDTVTTGTNRIVAGNLDVELEYLDADGAWQKVTEETKLFSELEADGETENLWEPGHTEVVYLKISNAGTLALKYQFAVTPSNETKFENVLGDKNCVLSNYLVFGQKVSDDKIEKYASREKAWEAAGNTLGLKEFTKSNEKLLPDKAEYVALIVYMPTTVGNEANYRGDVVPSIDLGITLLATQTPYEEDSFGADYDENVMYPSDWDGTSADTSWYTEDDKSFELDTAAKLAGFAKLVNEGTDFAGKTVALVSSINLNENEWTPIGTTDNKFNGTFDGNNNTISGLKISSGDYVGLFSTMEGATVKNLSIKDADITTTGKAGVVAGLVNVPDFDTKTTFENVTVSGKITAGTDGSVAGFVSKVTGSLASNSDWSGDTVGIVFKDCTSDVTLTVNQGTKAAGFVSNNGGASLVFENCTNNGDITVINAVSGKEAHAAGIVCYAQGEVSLKNCHNTGNIYSESVGTGNVGGLISTTQWGTDFVVENCSNSGDITVVRKDAATTGNVGGLIGRVNGKAVTISNSKASGKITVQNETTSKIYAGDIVGYSDAGVSSDGFPKNKITIDNVTANMTAVGSDETTCVGNMLGGFTKGYPIALESVTVAESNVALIGHYGYYPTSGGATHAKVIISEYTSCITNSDGTTTYIGPTVWLPAD